MRTTASAVMLALALAACSPGTTTTTLAVTTTVPDTSSTAASTTTLGTTTTTASPVPTTTVAAPDVTVSGGVVDGPDRIEVDLGSLVEITVLADVADEIHVHGYDLTFPTEPGVPTLVSFSADAQGIFEVELEEAGLPLFELVVAP